MYNLDKITKIIIISFIMFLSVNCLAEEPQDFLKNVEVVIRSLQPEKQDIKISDPDEKLARAIAEASAYAYAIGDDNKPFSYEMLALVVKKCRYFYDKEKPKMSFVEYIKRDLDRNYANCEHWILYWEAFKNQQ